MDRRLIALMAATALCAALCHGATPDPGPPEPEPTGGTCDADYECKYQKTIVATNVTYYWDFSLLCRSGNGGTYSTNDTTGHMYEFNFCGTTPYRCLPQRWDAVYEYGVAVQHWGATPPCNQSAPECSDFDGHPHCCTQDCQVLGIGPPVFKLKDPQNPETGGITVSHFSVPPSGDDPFWCGWDPKTGTQHRRSITFDITCDPNGNFGEIDVHHAVENATKQCDYTIFATSRHGCGCAPLCTGKNCGPDGCFGYCGSQEYGLCPADYYCQNDGICCRPDCSERDCGGDGCGRQCGTNNGDCPAGESCVKAQCLPNIYTPTPPPIKYKNSGSTIAGAFFGGLISAVVVGGIGIWWFQRRGGGSYTPFSTTASAAPSSSSAAAAAPAPGAGGYGAL